MNNIMKVKQTPAAELVEEYIMLRDLKSQAKKTFEEFCRTNYETRMEEIQGAILDKLNELGVDSISGKSGSAFKTTQVSVTTADMREFRRHVIGSEAWDLCDWRPNKTAVNDLIDAGEALPPGINRTTFLTIGIRRKS